MSAKTNPEWARMRKTHLLTYPECRACGTRDDVVVHHLRYRGPRGASELPGDLMTLCRVHHDDYHRSYGNRDLIASSLAYVEMVALDLAIGEGERVAG